QVPGTLHRRRRRQFADGPPGRTETRPLRSVALALDRLAVAGGVFERGEAGRRRPAARRPLAPRGRERRRGADDAAEQERPKPPRSPLAVHATSVREGSWRSVRAREKRIVAANPGSEFG